MSEEKKKWFAVYTKPRWEKKVVRLLSEKNVEVYCPLSKSKRNWSDRIKIVEEPIFKSYVFVRTEKQHLPAIRLVTGVVNFVYYLGKPAIIKDKEIEGMKRFFDEHQEVCLQNEDIKTEKAVVIRKGIFMGQKATVLSINRKYAKLKIQSLGLVILAEIKKKKRI